MKEVKNNEKETTAEEINDNELEKTSGGNISRPRLRISPSNSNGCSSFRVKSGGNPENRICSNCRLYRTSDCSNKQ